MSEPQTAPTVAKLAIPVPTRHLQLVPAQCAATAYLATLAPRSRETQVAALRTICRLIVGATAEPATFPWEEMTYAHAAALRQRLSELYAPATTNRLLAAWRGVLRAAWRLGRISDTVYLRAVDVKDVRGSDMLRGRALPADERTALFAHTASDPRPVGRRDGAILVCLYGCGLRRAEAASLTAADVTSDGLRVRGKGGKVRVVPIPPSFVPVFEHYVSLLPGNGPLLRAIDPQSGMLTERGLTASGIRKALGVRVHACRLGTTTPHDLRRSYITDLLGHGVDPLTVASLAGHARLDTTRKYDHRPHAARVAAVAVLGKEPSDGA